MKPLRASLLLAPFLFLTSCNNSSQTADRAPANVHRKDVAQGAGGNAGKKLRIGYVLHGLNDFTQVIKRGAEDAGKALGVDVDVTGPASFKAEDAINQFEGMVQKKVDGLVCVPMPGAVWVKPIKEAVDAGIPVATANITSPDSVAESWFGQDEYQSGVILANEIKKQLEAAGTKAGKIAVGNCAIGVDVLEDRYKGFKKGLEGSGYKATDETDVGTENTKNYAAWENMASANPDAVAIVGLCSMDIPNLARLHEKSKAKWLVGGYDLGKDQLDALKSGHAHVVLGQHPYLQGYLPVLALVNHLRDKKPLPKGWVDVGTEIITKANVDTVYARETDRAAETKWYADHIAKTFVDLGALAKPLPKH